MSFDQRPDLHDYHISYDGDHRPSDYSFNPTPAHRSSRNSEQEEVAQDYEVFLKANFRVLHWLASLGCQASGSKLKSIPQPFNQSNSSCRVPEISAWSDSSSSVDESDSDYEFRDNESERSFETKFEIFGHDRPDLTQFGEWSSLFPPFHLESSDSSDGSAISKS